MNSVSLNDIPYEVLYNIYSKVCQCNSPLLNYRIQFVNRSFKDIVNNYNGRVCRHINDSDVDKNISLKRARSIYHQSYNGPFVFDSLSIEYDNGVLVKIITNNIFN